MIKFSLSFIASYSNHKYALNHLKPPQLTLHPSVTNFKLNTLKLAGPIEEFYFYDIDVHIPRNTSRKKNRFL